MKKNRKGFTLIELVIVIAILGILAMYAVPKYQGIVEQARSAEARAQLGAFRSALGVYYAKNHGVYPTSDEVEQGMIFAEEVVPTVEVTKADGTLLKSNRVQVISPGDGKIYNESEIDGLGGWAYDVSTLRDSADVRINAKGKDRANDDKIWWTY